MRIKRVVSELLDNYQAINDPEQSNPQPIFRSMYNKHSEARILSSKYTNITTSMLMDISLLKMNMQIPAGKSLKSTYFFLKKRNSEYSTHQQKFNQEKCIARSKLKNILSKLQELHLYKEKQRHIAQNIKISLFLQKKIENKQVSDNDNKKIQKGLYQNIRSQLDQFNELKENKMFGNILKCYKISNNPSSQSFQDLCQCFEEMMSAETNIQWKQSQTTHSSPHKISEYYDQGICNLIIRKRKAKVSTSKQIILLNQLYQNKQFKENFKLTPKFWQIANILVKQFTSHNILTNRKQIFNFQLIQNTLELIQDQMQKQYLASKEAQELTLSTSYQSIWKKAYYLFKGGSKLHQVLSCHLKSYNFHQFLQYIQNRLKGINYSIEFNQQRLVCNQYYRQIIRILSPQVLPGDIELYSMLSLTTIDKLWFILKKISISQKEQAQIRRNQHHSSISVQQQSYLNHFLVNSLQQLQKQYLQQFEFTYGSGSLQSIYSPQFIPSINLMCYLFKYVDLIHILFKGEQINGIQYATLLGFVSQYQEIKQNSYLFNNQKASSSVQEEINQLVRHISPTDDISEYFLFTMAVLPLSICSSNDSTQNNQFFYKDSNKIIEIFTCNELFFGYFFKEVNYVDWFCNYLNLPCRYLKQIVDTSVILYQNHALIIEILMSPFIEFGGGLMEEGTRTNMNRSMSNSIRINARNMRFSKNALRQSKISRASVMNRKSLSFFNFQVKSIESPLSFQQIDDNFDGKQVRVEMFMHSLQIIAKLMLHCIFHAREQQKKSQQSLLQEIQMTCSIVLSLQSIDPNSKLIDFSLNYANRSTQAIQSVHNLNQSSSNPLIALISCMCKAILMLFNIVRISQCIITYDVQGIVNVLNYTMEMKVQDAEFRQMIKLVSKLGQNYQHPSVFLIFVEKVLQSLQFILNRPKIALKNKQLIFDVLANINSLIIFLEKSNSSPQESIDSLKNRCKVLSRKIL